MKKILFTFILLGVISSTFSQEAADKKIQAGLVAGFGLNFTTPSTNYVSKNGVGTDLTIGMNLNFNFSPTIGVNTGLEFDFETIKYRANPNSTSNLYYIYNDANILTKEDYLTKDGAFSTKANDKLYQVTVRKEKPIYLTIPTMMLFRTKFIGYFRYFGKFGVRNSILLGSTIFDEGISYSTIDPTSIQTPMSNNNLKTSSRDLSLYKGAVGLSGGVEWNFSGTTCLVAELGYYYGFVNINRGKAITGDEEKNMSVFTDFDSAIHPTLFSQLAAKQNQLMLKVSILF